jgi:hypothetical protein
MCMHARGAEHEVDDFMFCTTCPLSTPHAPSPLAAAKAAWRGRGRVPLAGWSYGGVGPERGLRGSTKGARRG